jgi:hypothetical protein
MSSTFREIMQSVLQTGKDFFSRSKSQKKECAIQNNNEMQENMNSMVNSSTSQFKVRDFLKKNNQTKQILIQNQSNNDDRFNEYVKSDNPLGFFNSKWDHDFVKTKNVKAVKIEEENLMNASNDQMLKDFYKQSEKLTKQNNLLGKFFSSNELTSSDEKIGSNMMKYNHGKFPPMTPIYTNSRRSEISNELYHISNPSRIETNKIPKSNILLPKEWSLADFEIGRILGRGRFGHVYLAREKRTNFIVALKLMKISQIKKDESQFLLRRELEVQSRLKHSNILRCYGYFWDREVICFILEYASEGELYKHLKAQPKKRFSEKRTAFFIKQIISAFKYLHNKNILHRDLKVRVDVSQLIQLA